MVYSLLDSIGNRPGEDANASKTKPSVKLVCSIGPRSNYEKDCETISRRKEYLWRIRTAHIAAANAKWIRGEASRREMKLSAVINAQMQAQQRNRALAVADMPILVS